MYKITGYDIEEEYLVEHMDSMRRYAHRLEAKADMMEAMMNVLSALVNVSHEEGLYGNAFTLHLDDEVDGNKWGGVIRLHNVPANVQGTPMVLFDVEWVNEEPEDEYNKMLIDTYGENLNLAIYSDYDEDEDEDGNWVEIEKYYVEGARCPKSELYDTPEEAYQFANRYLQNIDLYTD